MPQEYSLPANVAYIGKGDVVVFSACRPVRSDFVICIKTPSRSQPLLPKRRDRWFTKQRRPYIPFDVLVMREAIHWYRFLGYVG